MSFVNRVARDPDLFLKSLVDAFFSHTTAQSLPRRNAHFFNAAKAATIGRLIALDRIIPRFERLSKEPPTAERMSEEDQLLYEFFSHAYSLVESFCFGAYFIGPRVGSNPRPRPRFGPLTRC